MSAMADDERPPEITPWGDRDPRRPDEVVGGFWRVNVGDEAGLYLTAEQREAIPERLKAHSKDGEGGWWEWSEENRAWCLPVVCLLSGRPAASLSEKERMCLYFAERDCREKYPHEWEQLAGRKLSRDVEGGEVSHIEGQSMTVERPGEARLGCLSDEGEERAGDVGLVDETKVVHCECRVDVPQGDTQRVRDGDLDELIKREEEKRKAKERQRVPERSGGSDRDR